jgi:CHRD domain
MHKKAVGVAAGILGAAFMAFLVASCGDSTSPKNKTYIANLIAANEGSNHTSPGSGVATFVDLGTEIDWTLNLTNITAVVASHIHGPAPAGTNASVIINLFIPNVATGTVNGEVAHGSITNANNANVSLDSLRTLFNNGNAYVNVHTTANPGGEIRDQVHPQ